MHRIELAWGHVRHDGKTLAADLIKYADERALAVLSSLFGGGQLLHHFGGYLTKSGQLLLEPCSVAVAYANQLTHSQRELLARLAADLAKLLSQECVLLVMIELDGTTNWVPASHSALTGEVVKQLSI